MTFPNECGPPDEGDPLTTTNTPRKDAVDETAWRNST
jgi:hypothetical protein